MKRALAICVLVFLSLITCDVAALAIDVNPDGPWNRRLKFAFQGPGVPPGDAFPFVCYVVAMPYELVNAIQKEAKEYKDAVKKGETASNQLAEKYKNGVPMPMYIGYYVAMDDFSLTFTSHFQSPEKKDEFKSFNEKESSYHIKKHRSWHGILAQIQRLASPDGADTMVYTLGLPPDPNYIPEIHKPALIPLAIIIENGHLSFYPRRGDFDATIINPKSGMVFKVIDKNFTIP